MLAASIFSGCAAGCCSPEDAPGQAPLLEAAPAVATGLADADREEDKETVDLTSLMVVQLKKYQTEGGRSDRLTYASYASGRSCDWHVTEESPESLAPEPHSLPALSAPDCAPPRRSSSSASYPSAGRQWFATESKSDSEQRMFRPVLSYMYMSDASGGTGVNELSEDSSQRTENSPRHHPDHTPLEFTLDQMPTLGGNGYHYRAPEPLAPLQETGPSEDPSEVGRPKAELDTISASSAPEFMSNRLSERPEDSQEIEPRKSSSPWSKLSLWGPKAPPALRTLCEVYYPMYLLPIPALLKLGGLRSHAELLESRTLVRWTPEMLEQSIFVSNQWLSFDHPDPRRQHLAALQRLLARLASGEVASVEAAPSLLVESRGVRRVRAKQWAQSLPQMHVWFDSVSMPLENGTVKDRALASTPAYVERCAMFLILAPICEHVDSGELVEHNSWGARGWCRLQHVAALLACRGPKVMVCRGGEAQPYFTTPVDALCFAPCQGVFISDERKYISCQSENADRERTVVRHLTKTLMDAKLQQLRTDRRIQSWHFLRGRRSLVLPDSTDVPASLGQSSGSRAPLESSKVTVLAKLAPKFSLLRFKLPQQNKAKTEARVLMLRRAVLSSDLRVVEEVLHGGGVDIEAPLPGEPMAGQPDGARLLADAMAFSSFEVVVRLLEARADVYATLSCHSLRGADCLMMAAAHHREDNVRAWLQMFPFWDIHRRMSGGLDALMMSAAGPGDSEGTLWQLLSSQADPGLCGEYGDTALHQALRKELVDLGAVKLLLSARADANAALHGEREQPRGVLSPVRLPRRRCKTSGAALPAACAACAGGNTPLHVAAVGGKLAAARLLLEARADSQARNARGLTPLEEARRALGAEPPQLAQILSCGMHPPGRR